MFDTYWEFAVERQRIFMARVSGQAPPWTCNPVLETFRFTNPYRASDRVSQYLIKNVIYDCGRSFDETFLRILFFKLFNRIETWEAVELRFCSIDLECINSPALGVLLAELRSEGTLYSGAYIMPPPRIGTGRKHDQHVELLRFMLKEHLPKRVLAAKGLAEVFSLLRSVPSIGPFLAYQFTIDLNYSPHLDFDEMEFVAAGPGALSGLKKCFSDPGDFTPEDTIKYVCDRQVQELESRNLVFPDLWGRSLKLIDCQNLFCEVDKYSRIVHPEMSGSGRTRIKQRFVPRQGLPQLRFPPKWGLDDRLPKQKQVLESSGEQTDERLGMGV